MYTVFDLHCDTADRLAWQSLPSDLKTASDMDSSTARVTRMHASFVAT